VSGGQHTPDVDPRIVELWRDNDAVGFLNAIIDGAVPASPHQEHAGLSIAKVEAGRVELDWLPPAHILNRAGIVHGGYLAIVLDDAAGLSASSLGEKWVPMLTMDLRIEYVRPAMPDVRHTAIGTIVHAGRTRIIADARVEDPDGRLVARASGTFTPNRAFAPERFGQ
jgi:uncharacterized protein (TIGR00369 family)